MYLICIAISRVTVFLTAAAFTLIYCHILHRFRYLVVAGGVGMVW